MYVLTFFSFFGARGIFIFSITVVISLRRVTHIGFNARAPNKDSSTDLRPDRPMIFCFLALYFCLSIKPPLISIVRFFDPLSPFEINLTQILVAVSSFGPFFLDGLFLQTSVMVSLPDAEICLISRYSLVFFLHILVVSSRT